MKRAAVASDADDGASAFERFESFARRLLSVPKKELDEKLAERRRVRRRAAKR